ncbi:hypothetical protein [Herpetosiphon sp. NSE202]|uniref:hypothetical protein n=1 Tax=Herpetosiphon sp. NSE202 TaxID=3351349 RepID=UPI003624DA41
MRFKRIIVNRHWIYSYLQAGNAEANKSNLPQSLYMDDPLNQERYIRAFIAPHFTTSYYPIDIRFQYKFKESLRYCLNVYDADIESDLEHEWSQPYGIYKQPRDLQAFLQRVWQVLFPDESWQIDDLDYYFDLNDSRIKIFDPLPATIRDQRYG